MLDDNPLYRVEIHRLVGDSATLKWSRDNGALTLPIRSSADPDADRKFEFYREDGGGIVVGVEGLDAAAQQLQKDEWMEIVDEGALFGGVTNPFCRLGTIDGHENRLMIWLEDYDCVADEPWDTAMLDRCEKFDFEELCRSVQKTDRPYLRRWVYKEAGAYPGYMPLVERMRQSTDDKQGWRLPPTTTIKRGKWLKLENGIEIRFSETGDFQVGDYWVIPARGVTGGILWPQHTAGKPQSLPPQGVQHHYAPLATLKWSGERWRVTRDLRPRFPTLSAVADELPALEERARRRLAEEVTRLREQLRTEIDEARGVHRLRSGQDLTPGDVVSIVPNNPGQVVRANRDNAALVVGVVTERLETEGEHSLFRIVSQGKADCKVIGPFQPGDLLVPSERDGFARRGGFYVRPGTLLGKVIAGESTRDDAEHTAAAIVMLG
jgi:hypothetical protein